MDPSEDTSPHQPRDGTSADRGGLAEWAFDWFVVRGLGGAGAFLLFRDDATAAGRIGALLWVTGALFLIAWRIAMHSPPTDSAD